METLNENDIISHLNEQIKFHSDEIKKTKNLLSAFKTRKESNRYRMLNMASELLLQSFSDIAG